jgi:hypothetical protein
MVSTTLGEIETSWSLISSHGLSKFRIRLYPVYPQIFSPFFFSPSFGSKPKKKRYCTYDAISHLKAFAL